MRDVAVAPRVPVEIFLMVFLRRAPVLQRQNFNGGLSSEGLLQGGNGIIYGSLVLPVGVVDAGPVLYAPVVALSVDAQRIYASVEYAQKFFQRDRVSVIDDFNSLRMSGTGADGPVIGFFGTAVGISRAGAYDASYHRQILLHTPETTARKIDRLHALQSWWMVITALIPEASSRSWGGRRTLCGPLRCSISYQWVPYVRGRRPRGGLRPWMRNRRASGPKDMWG